MRNRLIFFVFVLFGLTFVGSQELLTPSKFFEGVSGEFGDIRDYQANITIDQNDGEIIMSGTLIYKSPNKLRIDFTEPREQVLAMDGQILRIYIPMYSYVLEQPIKRSTNPSILFTGSEQELSYLKDNYNVAYLVGPDPVPLDEDSDEMVVKLKFQSHTTAEGFKQLEIAFSEQGMIRRVKGKTLNGNLVMDFTKIATNLNIPDARFDYKAPPNANVFNDFLFEGIE